MPVAREQVAVTPARASETTRSLIEGRRSPLRMTSGVTTSATPSADGHVAAGRLASTRRRATDPTPNQWFAGLSRVHQCAATSASGAPNGRPITAVAVWYTGSPPGRGGGEPHPQQPVLADRPRHAGAELDPVRAVPQQRSRR